MVTQFDRLERAQQRNQGGRTRLRSGGRADHPGAGPHASSRRSTARTFTRWPPARRRDGQHGRDGPSFRDASASTSRRRPPRPGADHSRVLRAPRPRPSRLCRTMKDIEAIQGHLREIGRLENEADRIYRDSDGALFANPPDILLSSSGASCTAGWKRRSMPARTWPWSSPRSSSKGA